MTRLRSDTVTSLGYVGGGVARMVRVLHGDSVKCATRRGRKVGAQRLPDR